MVNPCCSRVGRPARIILSLVGKRDSPCRSFVHDNASAEVGPLAGRGLLREAIGEIKSLETREAPEWRRVLRPAREETAPALRVSLRF